MVDLQKLQMDLMAKKGECSGLEEQVGEGIRALNALMGRSRGGVTVPLQTEGVCGFG